MASKGSMEPKGSTNGIQGFRRIKSTNGNQMTLVATRRVFVLLVRPKQSGLCPKPHWGSLQHSPTSPSLLPPFQEPFPGTRPSASNYMTCP